MTAIGLSVSDRGNVVAPEPEALAVTTSARATFPRFSRPARSGGARRGLRARRLTPARARWRPCDCDGHPRRPCRRGRTAGRRDLDRCPWRPEHAGDEPVRQRPRDATRCGPRTVGGLVRPRSAGLARARSGTVALVGIRSLDPAERAFLREADIRVFTMSDIDRIGIEHAMREALDRVAGPGFVDVSLDLDSLDPEVAPGVGTPVPGGLTYREAHLACELIAESGSPARSSWSSRTRSSTARIDRPHRGRARRERARPDDPLVPAVLRHGDDDPGDAGHAERAVGCDVNSRRSSVARALRVTISAGVRRSRRADSMREVSRWSPTTRRATLRPRSR